MANETTTLQPIRAVVGIETMNFFKLLGFLVWAIGGIWGAIASFGFLATKIGVFWAIVSMFFAPISLPLAAVWAGLSEGNWSILMIGVGSYISGMLLSVVGSKNT
jgi:hypothetical protein